MEIEQQTLLELLDRLDELDDDLTIYAEANPEWRAESPAMVAEENENGGVPQEAQGLTYFLEVFIAKEVVEGFVNNEVRNPTRHQICDRIIHYARYDA